MKLKDYIPKENIVLDLEGSTKIDIIKELLSQMKKLNLVDDYDSALDDILAREGYLSTGLENGLAIPHAKTDGIKKLTLVFGLKKNGVEFESLDAKPAHLIFLVLSPRDTSGPHIQALAMITRNLRDFKIREKIKNAQSTDEIAKIFQSFD